MSAEQGIEVSVVIVTYNNEREILPCLDALRRELTGGVAEIIVVENHSSDETGRLVVQQQGDFDTGGVALVLVRNRTNVGFTRGLNQGLTRSRGEYILVLNPDTVLQEGCLAVLLGVLAEQDRVGVVAPQLLNPDGTVQPSCRRFPRYRDVLFEASGLSRAFPCSRLFNGWKMGDFDHTTRRAVDQPQGACLLFHRSVLTRVGLWDEGFPMFFSDVDWCRRVKRRGYEIWFEPTARVVHLQGRSIFQHRPRMIWSSHCSFYRYFRKYGRLSPANVLVGAVLFFSAIVRVAWHALFGHRRYRSMGRQTVLVTESTGAPGR